LPPSPPDMPMYRSSRPAPRPGHNGGAWKVAYADFVTALLALFIVLWMMNSSTKVKQSIAGYFKDPRGYTARLGAGPAHAGEGLSVDRSNVAGLQDLIEQALHRMPEFKKVQNNIKFSVTGEGLRIDLMENAQGMFFVSGSPTPTEAGNGLLHLLADEIRQMPNQVVIEGHTDASPFRGAAPASGYGNWELSADRANAARRLLHQSGLRPEQVVEVRGFADQKLLRPDDPNDPKNRRVSLVVRFFDEEGKKSATGAEKK
jgi:chemotaxis protein MotB